MAFPELQAGEGDFTGSVEKLAKLDFFDALEVGQINDPKARLEFARVAGENGFKLGWGAQPLILGQSIDLNSLEQETLHRSLAKVKSALNEAASLQAESFVLLSGKDPGAEKRDQAYTVLAYSLQVLGNYAKNLGIRLVLEIFDRSVDKCALVGPSDEARQLAYQVRKGYPDFGLLYDMGHMPLLGETPDVALPLLKDYLVEAHLGNCVTNPQFEAYGDKHPSFDYPGGVNGTRELTHFLEVLFEIGYLKEESDVTDLPWVGFEVRPQAGETTDQILDNIQRTWKSAWNQLV